ncbi:MULTISPECIES: hypothetical protein [Aquimarina]|uniref:Lipoprotein n=1 Tax=Aquimarina algiphila TaxID=2047982 RepID=A0A554VGY3_9FLAO|nr:MULTISPECIES: hypothetical protein [Aquimarina]TSE06694.1 hypothetical protein FOF46_18485 [Aquimarina algiphila]
MKALLSMFFLLFVVSCSKTEVENKFRSDYVRLIQEYNNFYHSPLKNNTDLVEFQKYLDNKYDYIDYVKNNYHDLRIEDSLLIIKDKKSFFFRKEYKIDLKNEIPENNSCNFEEFVMGIHTYKDQEKIEVNLIKEELQKYLTIQFDSLVTLPFYSKNDLLIKRRKIITLKYYNNNISVLCHNDIFNNKILVDSLKSKIENYLKSLKPKYDYVLIPLEINE